MQCVTYSFYLVEKPNKPRHTQQANETEDSNEHQDAHHFVCFGWWRVTMVLQVLQWEGHKTGLFSLSNMVVQYSRCVEQVALPQLTVCIQPGMLPPYPVRTSSLNNVVECFSNQERLPEKYIERLIWIRDWWSSFLFYLSSLVSSINVINVNYCEASCVQG